MINVTGYEGEIITIDYNITYPSTPPLIFTESITALVPDCKT